MGEFLARKEDVRKAILELNAEGTQQRKRKTLVRQKYHNLGLKYVWHIDGHDKLKPSAFSGHGCTDGFLKKLVRLEVTSSSKIPEII